MSSRFSMMPLSNAVSTPDIEPDDPLVHWFRLERTGAGVVFRPHLIDRASGVDVQVVATDVTGDRKLDIVTASKLGAFVFINGR